MDEEDLATLYRIRFPEGELERKNAIWEVLCRHYFQALIPPGSTVVDLACGYGEFINNIQAREKIAVDLNPESKPFLREEVAFLQTDAANLGEVIAGRADVVFTSNFLEHLPDKAALDSLLQQIYSALRPGGCIMVMGPNLRYLPGRYWDFYDHHLGLTHLSLSEALALRGFRVQRCVDRFLPYTTRGAMPTHPALVRAYLACPILWKLLGKQFFIVASRAENGGSRDGG